MTEGIELVDGVEMLRISSVDDMDPFLMTIVSNSDLWMYLSSTGGLTAGRIDAATCIFPYETDDRLHHLGGRVGPATALRVHRPDGPVVWEPFRGEAGVERSLLKSTLGNSVVFEERHDELGLTIRARWAPSDRFGWVRTVSLVNRSDGEPITVDLVDGLLDVMPWGIGVTFQQQRSNLANAYRRSEIVAPGIGVYSLEALIVDLPEPAEALRATTVWAAGLDTPRRSVDPTALADFRDGKPFHEASLRTGRPGSFLVAVTRSIEAGQTLRWHVVADAAQSHTDIARLAAELKADTDLVHSIDDDVDRCSADLRRLVAGADGVQLTGSATVDAHHLANTLFNVMRGGTFADGYTIDAERFREFVRARHLGTAERHAQWLAELPHSLDVADLRARASAVGDPNLTRLAHEYLPLTFSRRHGDPSRPWNQFAIRVQDQDGAPILSYQGNWRDIFQNWEALCRTFPLYLPSMIAKFVNASTADGFNPYRITSEGIDWEIPDPDDPWSGIGYWGDHQIVYLYRLLRAQRDHDPDWLRDQLARRDYSFADVPYRIAPFDRLLVDPKSTIEHDEVAEAEIARRVGERGADGRLVVDRDGDVVHVALIEKLLVPALAKLSNLVPRGGIWMNTERPEWNDANNALVGYGLSMVTLAHLRRYLELLDDVTRDADADHQVSASVVGWIDEVSGVLAAHDSLLGGESIDDRSRFAVLEGVGRAFDRYRTRLYESGTSEPATLPSSSLRAFLATAIRHLDDSVRTARRPDGLYDAYNLISFRDLGGDGAASVSRLAPMLEGQVAAISSGLLDVDDVVALVDQMYRSDLYRPDVDSFLLYPARSRPSFLERNQVPPEAVESNPLLAALTAAGNVDVIARDADGRHHFHPDLENARHLEAALDALAATGFSALVDEHRAAVLGLYEEVFRHHMFTGRSSTMYGYEGIGSIYWHMVAKLLLAVQESVLEAPSRTDAKSLRRLGDLYDRIRGGLGFNKSADEYGAFPTDPYSHTPAHAGAQQPGMTGQVKEELLTRWAELGVTVGRGSIRFVPDLFHERELRVEPGTLDTVDVAGSDSRVDVPAGAAALTLCRVPVAVEVVDGEGSITITHADGTRRDVAGLELDGSTSRLVFEHRGEITRLVARLPSGSAR